MKSKTLFRTLALSCALSAAVVAAPSDAHAEDEYPLVYGQRPVVLTKGLSQIEAAFVATKFDGFDDTFLTLNASYDYGILENLTAGILAVPLDLSPEADYGNPRVYGRYRLLSGAFDLAVNLGITLPVNSGDLGVDVGVLARFFLNKATFVNVGAYLGISFADGTPMSISIPIELAISFTRNLFFQVETGFNLPSLDFTDIYNVPLGVGLGYTLPGAGDGPMLDLYLKFGFPNAISNAGAFENMTWQAMLGGRFYL